MLTQSILDRLKEEIRENPSVRKTELRESAAKERLSALGLATEGSFFEFFSKYSPTAMLLSVDGKDLNSIDNETDEITETTLWAHEIGLNENFILFTGTEGEYFLAYSKKDGKVYGINFGEFDAANDGTLPAKWDSFEDLLIEYLEV